jgi:hypothetical protein
MSRRPLTQALAPEFASKRCPSPDVGGWPLWVKPGLSIGINIEAEATNNCCLSSPPV